MLFTRFVTTSHRSVVIGMPRTHQMKLRARPTISRSLSLTRMHTNASRIIDDGWREGLAAGTAELRTLLPAEAPGVGTRAHAGQRKLQAGHDVVHGAAGNNAAAAGVSAGGGVEPVRERLRHLGESVRWARAARPRHIEERHILHRLRVAVAQRVAVAYRYAQRARSVFRVRCRGVRYVLTLCENDEWGCYAREKTKNELRKSVKGLSTAQPPPGCCEHHSQPLLKRPNSITA